MTDPDNRPSTGSDPAADPANQRRLERCHQLYDEGRFADAIRELEAVTGDEKSAAVQSALARIAAIAWYKQQDSRRALDAISRMTRVTMQRTEVRIILDHLTDRIIEELRSLVRRGDRREAFRQLRSLISHLPEGVRREELVDFYTAELGSHHLTRVDDRLAGVNRQLNLVAAQLAKLSAGEPTRGDDAAMEEVECKLRTYALSEERERLLQLRTDLIGRELRVLESLDLDQYIQFIERSRQNKQVDEILDSVHLLCLEKMHYKTTLRFQPKDYLVAFLPSAISGYVMSGVYRKIQELERKIATTWPSFLVEAYR